MEQIVADSPSLILRLVFPKDVQKKISESVGRDKKSILTKWSNFVAKMIFEYSTEIMIKFPCGQYFGFIIYRFPVIGGGVQTIPIEDFEDFINYGPFEEQVDLTRTPRFLDPYEL
jgi:hypothetical protein